MGAPPPPTFTVGASSSSSSSSSGPAPTQVPALTRDAEFFVLQTPEEYMDRLLGLSETGLYRKQKMTRGSFWSSVIKVVNNVLQKEGSGRRLTNEEQEIYDTEPFIRDFDFTIQYLQSLDYLKADPTIGDIERAHKQFYINQVDETYGQKGKGKGRTIGKKQVGPIATTPM